MRDFLQVLEPDLARALAEIVGFLVDTRFQVQTHVLGRERLAVVPCHTLAQLEGELGAARVPSPAFRQIGDDRLRAVAGFHRIEQHEIVEHRHGRHDRRDRRFLVDRQARGIGADVAAQRAAGFLGEGRRRAQHNACRHHGDRELSTSTLTSRIPFPSAGSRRLLEVRSRPACGWIVALNRGGARGFRHDPAADDRAPARHVESTPSTAGRLSSRTRALNSPDRFLGTGGYGSGARVRRQRRLVVFAELHAMNIIKKIEQRPDRARWSPSAPRAGVLPGRHAEGQWSR